MDNKTPEQELNDVINKVLLDYVNTVATKPDEAFLTGIGTIAVTKAIAEIMEKIK